MVAVAIAQLAQDQVTDKLPTPNAKPVSLDKIAAMPALALVPLVPAHPTADDNTVNTHGKPT